MFALRRVVFWQFFVCLSCSLLFWIFSGRNSGLSALCGGAVCAFPSLLVILMMWVTRNAKASPFGIFLYEFFKVTMIIFGFLIVAMFYKNLDWLSFIISSGAVLLSHVFALASRK
ncbi:MAG: ATP synthase subunit I [Burkholderiales bacterium]|uniref:ATP synthase subunit I n=1 Tax=uncultured Turicimonas sp. TaxID=1918607 RepID=UPI001ED3E8B1|nr:ATP synthase subunit I [uncultured Turicimonas sp.]MBS4845138.1 ATP synthase subunit I [Burkholderiales bacterium]